MKIVVQIDLPDIDPKDILDNVEDWIVEKDGVFYISVDEAHMKTDPRDDSFLLFELNNPLMFGGHIYQEED